MPNYFSKTLQHDRFPLLTLVSSETSVSERKLVAVLFKQDQLSDYTPLSDGTSCPVLFRAEQQLAEYLSGQRKIFDLPLELRGTAFQVATWQALASIPYGETISYSEQAARVGNPQAVRAIGRTNGLNRLPIVLPCHRVVGKSGELTGYAGGLELKQALLELEQG